MMKFPSKIDFLSKSTFFCGESEFETTILGSKWIEKLIEVIKTVGGVVIFSEWSLTLLCAGLTFFLTSNDPNIPTSTLGAHRKPLVTEKTVKRENNYKILSKVIVVIVKNSPCEGGRYQGKVMKSE